MDITLWLPVVIWLQVGACIWFFYSPYRQYRIDAARYHLFVIRDQLFDAAADGKISFDHPAYGMTRTTLNGMIRNIEADSLLRSILVVIWLQRSTGGKRLINAYRQQYENSMVGVSEDTRKILDQARLQAVIAVMSYISHTSLLLWVICIPLFMVWHGNRLLNRLEDRLEDRLANRFGEVVRFDGHQAMVKEVV